MNWHVIIYYYLLAIHAEHSKDWMKYDFYAHQHNLELEKYYES